VAGPAAAQSGYGELGPDSPAVEAAARAALPQAEIRRVTPEVRRIEGLTGATGGLARTVSGSVSTLEGVSRSPRGGDDPAGRRKNRRVTVTFVR